MLRSLPPDRATRRRGNARADHPSTRGKRLSRLTAPHDRQAIEAQLRDVQLKLGTTLCAAGEPIEYVYFPTCGMVSLAVNLNEGDEVETGVVGRTGVVGSAVGAEKSFHRCMVQIAGEGRRLPRAVLLPLTKTARRSETQLTRTT
jgi:CRP-like cAMP-binding protein